MRPRLPLLLLLPALGLTACAGGGATDDQEGALRVGASPVPHGEILQFVADELAPEAGLDLEIVEFTDYVQPNIALDDGSIDANYFQTEPYLAEQEAAAGYDFTTVSAVHVEPLGLYSQEFASVDEITEGARIALPNDPTNVARSLALLQDEELITLADTGSASATVLDVQDNPLGLQFAEIEAAQLPRALPDVDAAVINGNYALEADLSPVRDAIAAESAEGNPHANLLVALTGSEDDPRLQELAGLLSSAEVAAFIEESYAGTVVPAP